MFCPKCRSEYKEEFKICADCETQLVDQLDEELEDVYEGEPELIFTTSNLAEANLIRGLLQANGIRSYSYDQYVSSLNPFLNMAVGGIKIYVKPSQKNLAAEVLTEYRSSYGQHPHVGDFSPFNGDDKSPQSAGTPQPESSENSICSSCNATNEPDSNFCDQCGHHLRKE